MKQGNKNQYDLGGLLTDRIMQNIFANNTLLSSREVLAGIKTEVLDCFKMRMEKIDLVNGKKFQKCYDECLQYFDKKVNDYLNRYQDSIKIKTWFGSVHAGYDEFCNKLPKILANLVGNKWVKAELHVAQNRESIVKSYDVVVTEAFAKSGFFNKVHYIDERAKNRLDGYDISLQCYLFHMINDGKMILIGENGKDSFATPFAKLNPDSNFVLPCLAFPITQADCKNLKFLAKKNKFAERELRSYFNSSYELKDVKYYDLYSQKYNKSNCAYASLRGALEHYINKNYEIRSMIAHNDNLTKLCAIVKNELANEMDLLYCQNAPHMN